MSDDQALTLIPQVTTLAKPQPRVLLSARFEVQRNPALRKAFEEYKGTTDERSAEVLAEMIAQTLADKIEGSLADIRETARYLADEYQQIGDTLLLVSSATGLPIARIREEDIWQPKNVPRESGNMAKPQPRLKPALAGFLMSWHFENERERSLAGELATRLVQTQSLVEDGDPRLRPITKGGRDQLVVSLRESVDGILPGAISGGTPGAFLNYLTFGAPEAWDTEPFTGFTAFARTESHLTDHKARNLRFDEMGSTKATIAAQWVREIARTLSQLAHSMFPGTPQVLAEYETPIQDSSMWVAGGEELTALRLRLPCACILATDGAAPIEISGPVGHIRIRDYEVKHRVIHDRWQIAATMQYDLWIDWKSVKALALTELPVQVHVAEIV